MIYNEGDTTKGICYNCKEVVTVTMKVRDVEFSDNVGVAKDILVGVCDCCDRVILTPRQSTESISEQLKEQYESSKQNLKSCT